MLFTPNATEDKILQDILKIHPQEFALIRLTCTMLNKSIIDASATIRNLLAEGNIVDFNTIVQGPDGKIRRDCTILTSSCITKKVSFYRPFSKNGDPRFWIYGLNKIANPETMIYLSVHNSKLIIIPLITNCFDLALIKQHLGFNEKSSIKGELVELLSAIKAKGPVISDSPDKSTPKDVGSTLERELGKLPDSSKLPDFKGSVEIKAKRKSSRTKDTLFSMVPNWTISPISSSPEMILTHGYPSRRYKDFYDLYVTVGNTPNNQGLYLEVDDENGLLHQKHQISENKSIITCSWYLKDIKNRLFSKHPETLWVIGQETLINNQIYFHYTSAEYSHTPLFASFLLLISQGILTYDWRGRVRADGTGYKDKGHCFRISPKYRHLLFTQVQPIEL